MTIQNLPTEILCYIFSLQSFETALHDSQNSILLPVTHVCARWRAIACSTPSLFAYITFTFASKQELDRRVRLARLWSSRAAALPLALHISHARIIGDSFYEELDQDLDTDVFSSIIIPLAPRIQSLHLLTPPSQLENFSGMTNVTFPRLKTIHFQVKSLPFQELYDAATVREFISSCPTLVYCSVTTSIRHFVLFNHNTAFTLPLLQDLSATVMSVGDVFKLLNGISLPALARLDIGTTNQQSGVWLEFQKLDLDAIAVFSGIRELSIRNFQLGSSSVVTFLSKMPNITRLDFSFGVQVNEELLRGLTWDTQQRLLPHLTELTLKDKLRGLTILDCLSHMIQSRRRPRLEPSNPGVSLSKATLALQWPWSQGKPFVPQKREFQDFRDRAEEWKREGLNIGFTFNSANP